MLRHALRKGVGLWGLFQTMIVISAWGSQGPFWRKGSGWDTRAAEQPVKTGEDEWQGENEAQSACRGRRRKDKDRGRSQLLMLRTRSSCLAGKVRSLTAGHLLSSEVTSCVGHTLLPQFSQCGAHQNVAPCYPSFIHQTQAWTREYLNVYPRWTPLKCLTNMYWLINNSPHSFHPDMSTGSVLGVAINAAYWTQNHQLLKMLQTLLLLFWDQQHVSQAQAW